MLIYASRKEFFWLGGLINKTHGLLRGANWNNGVNAGVFTMNFNNATSNSNTNIGFRCVR